MHKPRRKPFSIPLSRKLLSTSALLFLLNACCGLPTSVSVPNGHFTYLSEASADVYATQFQFLVDPGKTTDISLAEWTAQSKGQLCMPLSDWTNYDKMISNFCSAPHVDCNYQLPSGQTVKEVFNQLFFTMQLVSGESFPSIQ